jgi:hypothetical protein
MRCIRLAQTVPEIEAGLAAIESDVLPVVYPDQAALRGEVASYIRTHFGKSA